MLLFNGSWVLCGLSSQCFVTQSGLQSLAACHVCQGQLRLLDVVLVEPECLLQRTSDCQRELASLTSGCVTVAYGFTMHSPELAATVACRLVTAGRTGSGRQVGQAGYTGKATHKKALKKKYCGCRWTRHMGWYPMGRGKPRTGPSLHPSSPGSSWSSM